MNSIGGVVVSVLALIVEDRVFYARHHHDLFEIYLVLTMV